MMDALTEVGFEIARALRAAVTRQDGGPRYLLLVLITFGLTFGVVLGLIALR